MSGTGAPSGRLLCVGDVHGCADELDSLLEALGPTSSDRLVFLGDYVDRGPASRRVVETLLELRRALPETVFLRGNHEEMLLSFLGRDAEGGSLFLQAGGLPTLASYGLGARPRDAASAAALQAAARERLPGEHLDFLDGGLRLWFRSGRFAFVHAGVRPGVPLERQRRRDLLWIREEFLGAATTGLDAIVVFGHTPQRDAFFGRGRKLGLDTGCVYGGRLTCLDLSAGRLYQVRRGERRATRRDVAALLEAIG